MQGMGQQEVIGAAGDINEGLGNDGAHPSPVCHCGRNGRELLRQQAQDDIVMPLTIHEDLGSVCRAICSLILTLFL